MTIHTRNGAIRARRLAGAVALLLAVAAQGADFSFNIPAGELKSALDAYIKQTGQQIVYKSDDVKGKTTPGVHGTLSDQQALDALLKGTGLQLRRDESGAVVVFPAEAVAGGASATAAGEQKLEEVVVTATAISHLYITSRTVTRLDTDPMLLPQSVSAVQADLLYAQQASTVTEVLNNVAGMDVSPDNTVTSRGFSVAASRNGTVEIGAASDKVKLRPTVATDRIEVVKGPEQIMQGTVAGIGGTVNLVTKVPQPEDSAYLGMAVGSQAYWRLDADVNGTLVGDDDGRLMGMAIASLSDEGDGRYGITGDAQNFFSAGLRWYDPGLGSDLSAVYEYDSTRTGPSLATVTTGGAFHNNQKEWLFGAKNGHADSDTDTVDVNFQQRLWGSWKLGVNYIWRDEKSNSNETQISASQSDPNIIFGDQVRSNSDLKFTTNVIKVDVHGQVMTGPVEHNLMVAYDYSKNEGFPNYLSYFGQYQTDLNTGDQTFTPIDPPIIFPNGSSTSEETGVLFTDQVNWEKWHLLLGVRWMSQTSHDVIREYDVNEKYSKDDTLPQYGLVYSVTPHLSLYASGSEGFTSNGGLKTASGALLPNATYTQYEAGVKSIMLDEQLVLTVAGYQIKQENVPKFIRCEEVPPFDCFYSTIAGITSKGVEVEASGQPIRGLQVRSAFTYATAEDNTTGKVPFTGYVPLKFSLWTQYWLTREAGSGWWVGGGLTANDAPKRTPEQATIPGNTVFDLSGGYQNEHWNGVFGIQNVGDVEGYYPIGLYRFGSGTTALGQQMPGREYRFDLSYRF
ncbi:MAG: TonB-dependent receptor [Steroidobacteraceae bacterium]